MSDISVVANFATTAADGKIYQVAYYNLDMVISVGYRVKSNKGIQFRQWANKVLKNYIVKGYVINQQVKLEQLEDLKNTVKLLSNVISTQSLTAGEATGLLQVITNYTYALDTLDRYDYQSLNIDNTTREETFRATYENAVQAIETLREKFGNGGLFANEKDGSFKSSINTIYQTFDGND
ncbi:MAG: virulence RhuM family protein, partial [Tannerellaceae bacterium]|nr:virulence RhuM family protein [Tannerellaceae bacterium]